MRSRNADGKSNAGKRLLHPVVHRHIKYAVTEDDLIGVLGAFVLEQGVAGGRVQRTDRRVVAKRNKHSLLARHQALVNMIRMVAASTVTSGPPTPDGVAPRPHIAFPQGLSVEGVSADQAPLVGQAGKTDRRFFAVSFPIPSVAPVIRTTFPCINCVSDINIISF